MSRRPIRFTLQATPAAVRAARHRISGAVHGWNVALSEDMRFYLELVSTELLTNAVRHARGPLTVSVALEGGFVVIEVVDGSTTVPLLRSADRDDEGGRGLALIDALCPLHGCELLPAGKRCWAVLPLRQTADAVPVANPADGGAAHDSARWSLTRAGARLLLHLSAQG
ncbi:ATP-binding protein [Streptomyces sp. NPDC101116]|uniref:ATP-binding protein n=1 Tax=Streptomyces sp. NPDC101116 TaxID=3366107 RepID=UPI00382532E9